MIIDTLKKQLLLHRSLLQLARQKQEAIKQNRIDDLNRIVRDEQKHIHAVAILEKQRKNDSEEPLSDLLPQLSPADRHAAEALRDETIAVINELKQTNDLNRELLEQSLQLVHLQLDLLAPPEAGNYRPDQDEDGPPPSSLFDSKA